MADEVITIREVRYQFKDKHGLGEMHVYVFGECDGPGAATINGWYHKQFPPGSTIQDTDIQDYLEWDRGSPR